MNKKYIRYIAASAVLCLVLFLGHGFYKTFINTEQEIYQSPKGTNTIIVQYDFVCRPAIYKKTLLGKKKIWEYEGPGFMETVHFDVEWLSEDRFRFYIDYYDKYNQEYIIELGDT